MKKLIIVTMVLAAMQGGVFAMAGPKGANLPKVSGQRYEAMVPDTLDLADRAALAINGMAGTIDPDNDYLMWFFINWHKNPPYMKHGGVADLECTPKFYDAMTLLRQVCGSQKHLDIERGMETAMMGWLNKDDGLLDAVYTPKRPWHLAYYPGTLTKQEDYALPCGSGILLITLIERNDLGLTPCEDQIRAMVRGLDKAAVKKDDYAYYPEGGAHQAGGGGQSFCFLRSTNRWNSTEEAKGDREGSEGAVTFYQAYQIRGLAMWYARSGDKQALELAGKLARYVMKPKFWGDASNPEHVVGSQQGHFDFHFHARAAVLRALLEYGLVTGDTRVCDFVRSGYEHMRSYGINQIGYIHCAPPRDYLEPCLLGDIVALTVKMSRAGIGDYWDDADRVIRNHLAEAQYTNLDLLKRASQAADESEPNGQPGQICTENVHERMLGTFGTWLSPTSSHDESYLCCTGNASRGIAYAWDGILDGRGDQVQVNLLLNRASKWLDVDSYLPYEGKVVIHNKTARRISVRIPAWVDRSKLKASVNGAGRRLAYVGSYVVFDDMKKDDKLQLDFPVAEETIRLSAHSGKGREGQKPYTTYTITFRGNTVVDISPRDESPNVYPLYLRDHMKAKKAPMKTIQRFVADKEVIRW